jgi:bilin biosynthesis protein
LSLIDTILRDDPSGIDIVHKYDQQPSIEFLLRDLFNTDFSRCYLALMGLRQCSSEVLWPLMSDLWAREAHNDYGAHYFFMRIFGSRSDWPEDGLRHVLEIIQESIINRRPQFRKSRAAAIQALHFLSPDLFIQSIPDFLSAGVDAPWDCHYMTALCLESMAEVNISLRENILSQFVVDPDPFVRARSEICLLRLSATSS